MLDAALAQVVASAVAEAQAPLLAALGEVRAELADARRRMDGLKQAITERLAATQEAYLRVEQVAQRLGVCKKTVGRWMDSGKLPFVTLPSGAKRVSVAALERVLHRAEAGLEAAE